MNRNRLSATGWSLENIWSIVIYPLFDTLERCKMQKHTVSATGV
ncbi:hypothetical protein ACVWZM_002200 [Bradyrhizobium sp. USDA 4501]